MKKYIIISSSLIIAICFIFVILFKRSFFSQKDECVFSNGNYYFKVEKYPSYVYPFYIGYKYEMNLPGLKQYEGYLNSDDSLIYELGDEGFIKSKTIFLNFSINSSDSLTYYKCIPSFDLLKKDESNNFSFIFRPVSFSFVPNIKCIYYKISYDKGFLEMEIIKDDGSILKLNSK